MKSLQLSTSSHTAKADLRSIFRKAAILLLILVGIQLINQFLIVTGGILESWLLQSNLNTRFWVGVYQQLVQAAAGIVLYMAIFKRSISDLGINTRSRADSRRWFGLFAWFWLLVILIYLGGARAFFPQTWHALKAAALPSTSTMGTTLLFQSFFPGLGEEILFRGLIVSLLAALVFPHYKEDKIHKMAILAFSGIYFAAAHVYYSVIPLEITHFNLQQVVTALACGAMYAAAYLKTRSLLAPFLMHNFANTTVTLCGYLIASL